MTPWSSGPLFPLSNRLFTSRLERFPSTIGLDDAFKDDFYEDDSMMPAMNIKEHEKDFEIEFAAPGFDKKDFEITIKDDVLHICGEKSKKETPRISTKVPKESWRYWRTFNPTWLQPDCSALLLQ